MPTNSSLVAYLVIIFIQLSNASSYEELTTITSEETYSPTTEMEATTTTTTSAPKKSTDSKKYPPMYQTYCSQANIRQLTNDLSSNLGTLSVEGIIRKNECYDFFKNSHECTHPKVETKVKARLHKKVSVKIGKRSYECKFSYIAGCETFLELLRHCFRYQGMPENYVRIFKSG